MENLNSLYTMGSNYKDNSFKYINGYWIATLGFLALAKKFPANSLLFTYLNKPAPISDEALFTQGDSYTDIIAAVKVLYENKTMPYPTWLKYCMFFREMHSKNYRTIDENTYKKLNKEMIQVNIRPHQLIQPVVFGYADGKIKLENTLLKLHEFNELYKISPNFRKYCLMNRKDL
mgnify:CR=1 FL=1